MEKVYITTYKQKENLLKNRNSLFPYKIIPIEELYLNYPYTYNEKAIDKIISKYHVIYEVAEIYYYQILTYPIEEDILLSNIKEYLEQENILIYNTELENYLQKKELVILCPYTKRLQNLLKHFHVTIQQETIGNYIPTYYEFETEEQEIESILEQIGILLQNNISPSHIFLGNVKEENYFLLKHIANLYHIPITTLDTPYLSNTYIGSTFLNILKTNYQDALEYIKSENSEISYQIIRIINKYIDFENKEMWITHELSITKAKETEQKESIKEIDFKEYPFKDNDYLFLLNCDTQNFPILYKDEDYLSDKQKNKLGYDTSNDLNKIEKERIKIKLSNIKHCICSYSKEVNGKKVFPSSLLENINLIKNKPLSFSVSHQFNEYYFAKELEEYKKYNTITKELTYLEERYEEYPLYSHDYKEISKNVFEHSISNQLTLSYTSLDTYLKCPFRYYLTYILKLNKMKDNFPILLGTIFHKVLESLPNANWEVLYEEEIKKYSFTYKELFFLEKCKQDLKEVINYKKEYEENTELLNTLKEKEVTIDFGKKENTSLTFTGKIDNINYIEKNKKTIFTITDYKTGSTKINLSYIPLGFSLQLPIYIYLSHYLEFQNPILGGIYLQNILQPRIKKEEKKPKEAQIKNNLKLQGYSTNEKDILSIIDKTYENSKFIQGLKIKADGNFYQNAKVLEENDFQELENTAKTHIENVFQKIWERDFKITSKIIDGKDNISCNFCPFYEICNQEEKDNVYLKSDPNYLKKEVSNELYEESITSH